MKVTIGKKILTGFSILAVLLGMISALSYYQIQKINNSYLDLVDRRAAILANVKDIQFFASREILGLKDILNEEESSMEFLQTAIEQIDEKIASTETLVPDQEAKELVLTITALNEELKEK